MAYEDDEYEESYDDTSEEETWEPYVPPEEPPPPPPPPPEPEPEAAAPAPLKQYAAADTGTRSDATEEETFEPYVPPPPVDSDYGTSDLGVPVGARTGTPEPEKAETFSKYEPPDTPFGAFSREVAHGAGPAAVGAITGGAAGGALGAAGFNPFTVVGGALVGGFAGGYTAEASQEAALKYLNRDDAAIRAMNAEAHPWSTAAGRGISNLAGFGAGLKKGATYLGERILGAGISGGVETGVQTYHGAPLKQAVPQVLSATAAGAAFPKPYSWGRAAEQAGASVGTRYKDWRNPPPPPAPPPPFDYGPQPAQGQMPWGAERQPELPFDQPAPPQRPGISKQPELAFEPPVVDAQGQYGFNITAPDIHSRSGMPPTSGVASEATPPTTLRQQMEAQPYSTEARGREALAAGEQPQQAAGINVLQPGQADPTVAHAQNSQVALTQRPSGPYGLEHPSAPGAPPPPRTTFEPPRPPVPPAADRPMTPIPRNQQIVPRTPDTTQGVMQEPVVRPGMTRLFRGDPRSPVDFTTDRAAAERYGPLRHVDVSQAQMQQQFRPGREPGSYAAHPVMERAYNKRLQPTVRMPTQPTQRQWPRPPGGPPPGPPPARGGPEPAGRPPTGVREAGPRLDAEINAAVGRAVQPAPAQPRAARYSREQANLMLNQRQRLNAEAARRGLPPDVLKRELADVMRAAQAPAAPTRVEQSVQRGRAAAEKINQREAAREAPIHAAQMGRQPPAAPPELTVKAARERAAAAPPPARPAAPTAAAPDYRYVHPDSTRYKGSQAARAERGKAWNAWLDEQAKIPGSKAAEWKKLNEANETGDRWDRLIHELDIDFDKQWKPGARKGKLAAKEEPAAEAPAAKSDEPVKDAQDAKTVDEFLDFVERRIRYGKYDADLTPDGTTLKGFIDAAEARGWTYGPYGKGKALWSPDRKHVMFADVSVEGNSPQVQYGTPGKGVTPPGAKFAVAPELAEAAKATSKAKAALAAKPASDEPRSLHAHIKSLGGLKGSPELKAILSKGDYLALVRKNGRSLDDVWENVTKGAPEERYIADEGANTPGRQNETDVNHLLDLLGNKAGKEHFPLGSAPKETPAQRERIDVDNARHDEGRTQINKDIDAWVESPDHDYYDPGMRDRMVELLEQGKATDPADAHAKAVEEWDDRQRAFEGDVGPPKDIPDQLPDSVGADGKPQMNMFGDAPQKDLAQRATDKPLTPKVGQKGADEGLFGTPPRDQAEMPVTPKEPAKKDAKEIDRLQQKYFDANRQLQNLEKQVKGGALEDTDPKYLNARRAAEDAINAWHEAEGIPLTKGKKEPLRSKVLERGRSGRPTKTTPLAIGSEEAILKAGYERATGPKEEPRPPSRQAAQRQGPEVTIKAFDADGNQTTFKGATAAEAVAAAKRAGHRDYQIYNADMTRYAPPKARAPTPAAAASPPAGGGQPPGGAGTPPAGGTPQPPRGPAPAATSVEAARKSILDQVADKPKWYSKLPTSRAEAKKAWNDFYTATKNAMHPIEQAEKAVMASGHTLSADEKFAQLARLTKGLGGRFTQMMRDGTYDITTGQVNGKSLDAVIKPIADDPNGFNAYALAKRVIELEGRGIKTGVNVVNARMVVAADGAKFEPVFRDLVDFQGRVLDNLVKSGVLSDVSAAKMRQMNKEYVPFYRMLDPDSELGQQLGAGLQTKNPIFRIKGSDKDILDPIESVIKNTYLYTDLAHRNQALVAMKAANNRLPADSQFMVRDRTSHPIEVQPQEIQKFMDKHGIEGFADDAMTIFRPNAFRPADDKIRLFNNGKAEVYTVPKEIGTAVNAMDTQAQALWLKIAATPARMLRAGAIYSPEFVLRNPLRDIISAFIQSKHGSIPVYDFAVGLKHLFKRSDEFQQWQISGGANANLVSMDRAMLHTDPRGISVVNKVVNPLQWYKMLQSISEVSENATRLGMYTRATGKGVHRLDAAFAAREGTLDFARMGSAPSMRALNSMIPFFNAQIEGVDQAARAFIGNKVGFTAKVAAGITLPSVLLWFKNKDDERVKELPAWQKDLFWIMPGRDNWVPMTADDSARWAGKDLSKLQNTVRQGPGGLERNDATIWRIPKPFELGVLFGSVPERMLDAYYNQNPNAFKNLGKTVVEALTPSVIPQAVLPVAEQFANRSVFLERPLLTEEQKKLPPAQQYGPHTSETSKLLGNVVRSVAGDKSSFGSPIMIDNYLRQWTGGLGKHVTDIIDTAVKSTKDLPPEPTKTLADMPGIKAFTARFPSQSAQSIQDFYDTRNDRKMEAAGIKDQRKTDPAGASERAKKADAFTGDPFAKILAADRVAIKRIAADPKMSPDEKRAATDLTYLLMIEHAKSGVEAFERTRKQREERNR